MRIVIMRGGNPLLKSRLPRGKFSIHGLHGAYAQNPSFVILYLPPILRQSPPMKLLLVFILTLTINARAVNSLEQDFTCPIDGHHWKQRIETSSNPRGMRLDRRELGDVVEPRTLPQCPKCRFVMFLDEFPEQLADKIKPFILSPDYQMIAAKNPTYFSLAQIQEFLKAPPLFIGQSYLRASWQVEEKDALCQRHLARALDKISAAFTGMKPSDRHYINTALLAGEIERRLSRWEDASKRFHTLRDAPEFKDPKLQVIIALQLTLIEKRDNKPHAIEEPSVSIAAPPPKLNLDPPPAKATTEPQKAAPSAEAKPTPAPPKPTIVTKRKIPDLPEEAPPLHDPVPTKDPPDALLEKPAPKNPTPKKTSPPVAVIATPAPDAKTKPKPIGAE